MIKTHHDTLRVVRGACFALLLLFALPSHAQTISLSRVEPMFWWVGMRNPSLQLLVQGKDISYSKVSFNYPGVSLREVISVSNPNFLFITLHIAPNTPPGKFALRFKLGKQEKVYEYELKARTQAAEEYRGFDGSDAMYLITPDRFANGNPANDVVKGMPDSLNRAKPLKRHGGDLAGIRQQLDYIQKLGFTSIWINPVLENNQPDASYHGYAITDYYKVDARFGTNEEYRELCQEAKRRGLKVVMDMVFNHCGSEHWWMKDMPTQDWVHQFPQFTRSNYRLSTSIDPYASRSDVNKMQQGWFDTTMPDLNQRQPLLATYLIQNSIWWVEYLGLGGIRMDTHPYPYKDMMAAWCKAVMTEYPNLNIVGEVWEDHVPIVAYWQTNALNRDGYQGNLPSITDFPLCFAWAKAFNEPEGWDKGLAQIYYVLAQDALYPNPFNNLTFLDNHDISRFATIVNGDISKMKMGLASLATMRGIPQFYYGTEIMMPGPGDNHGILRADMPGGWAGDAVNAFNGQGLSAAQTEILDYTRRLFNWRKQKTVIHHGNLMHFLPEDGVYVYFRYTTSECVMVILNNNTEAKNLSTTRFSERLEGFQAADNVLTGERLHSLQQITVPAKSATILELLASERKK